ncbi:hypothetical protein N7509_005741 [Penicillium cosmopolitanum]|uniref:Uncharacterized protein n=1 Tax=Penicillium cosmopolitanum TaxID=1131564 RepID=A0A9W9W2P8_9EURO|nr:uncharacterized protein N7509_005741 [Penicillium cosmopolitanum]KAJ5397628.1 hypothetical protein N7509_005741 [Penicillium cosmopolitanum]
MGQVTPLNPGILYNLLENEVSSRDACGIIIQSLFATATETSSVRAPPAFWLFFGFYWPSGLTAVSPGNAEGGEEMR